MNQTPDVHGPLLRGAYQGPMDALRRYLACSNGTLPTADELLACIALMQDEIARVQARPEEEAARADWKAEGAYQEGYQNGLRDAPNMLRAEIGVLRGENGDLEDDIQLLQEDIEKLSEQLLAAKEALTAHESSKDETGNTHVLRPVFWAKVLEPAL